MLRTQPAQFTEQMPIYPRETMEAEKRIDPLLTSDEAAAILKIDAKTIERMARRGEIPAFKLGKFWRYRTSDLASWIESKLPKSAQPSHDKGEL